MKKALLVLLLFISLILQVTVFSHLKIFGIKPDLILIIVLAIGFFRGSYQGMSFGFLGGFLEDVFSSAGLGTNALSKVLCGFLVSFVGKKVYENIGTQAVIIVTFSILDRIITLIILFLSSGTFSMSLSLIPQTIVYALYNLILGLLAFPLMKKFSNWNE